ncbi:MAG: sporulation protein YjcZ [Bacillota bacterium]
MGYGFGGGSSGSYGPGCGGGYVAPYFDGSFILFLVLILLVFGTGFGYGGYYGEK